MPSSVSGSGPKILSLFRHQLVPRMFDLERQLLCFVLHESLFLPALQASLYHRPPARDTADSPSSALADVGEGDSEDQPGAIPMLEGEGEEEGHGMGCPKPEPSPGASSPSVSSPPLRSEALQSPPDLLAAANCSPLVVDCTVAGAPSTAIDDPVFKAAAAPESGSAPDMVEAPAAGAALASAAPAAAVAATAAGKDPPSSDAPPPGEASPEGDASPPGEQEGKVTFWPQNGTWCTPGQGAGTGSGPGGALDSVGFADAGRAGVEAATEAGAAAAAQAAALGVIQWQGGQDGAVTDTMALLDCSLRR